MRVAHTCRLPPSGALLSSIYLKCHSVVKCAHMQCRCSVLLTVHTKCSRGGESLAHGRCPTSANAPARGTPAGSGRLHGRALGARVASAAPPTASCRCGRAAASKVAHFTGFVLTQTQGRGRVPVRLLQRREYVRRTLTARVPCERAAPSLVARDFHLPLLLLSLCVFSLSSSSLSLSMCVYNTRRELPGMSAD